MTVHHLRTSLEGKVRDSAELARLGRLMNGATQSLTSLRDPKDVIAQGTLAMFELAGSGFRGASYLRVSDGVVTQEALADDRGSVPTSYLLKDDPYVRKVLDTGEDSGHPTGSDLHGCVIALGHRRDGEHGRRAHPSHRE